MTDSEYMAGIAACLEPQAVAAVRDAKTQIELSTALSLKRIADALSEAEMIAALEATGHTVTPPDDQGMTVINTLEGGQTKTTIVAENFSVEVPPSWALDKAANMAGWDCWAAVPAKNPHLIDSIGAHARTLSKHETPPDPLVAEREFLAGLFESFKLSNRARLIRDGVDDTVVPAAMAYLRANKGRL